MGEQTYSDLLGSEFGLKKMGKRYLALRTEVAMALKALGFNLGVDVCINDLALQQVIGDYFIDVYKLKKFEHIKKYTNLQKVYGYTLYWFLRRKPIQVLKPQQGTQFINEAVCVHILIAKILPKAFNAIKKENKDKVLEDMGRVLENFYYNIKYREFSAKSLELFLDGFLLQVA